MIHLDIALNNFNLQKIIINIICKVFHFDIAIIIHFDIALIIHFDIAPNYLL
jgi:hypothetical protein